MLNTRAGKTLAGFKVEKHKTWHVAGLSAEAQEVAKSLLEWRGEQKSSFSHRAERPQVLKPLHAEKIKHSQTIKQTMTSQTKNKQSLFIVNGYCVNTIKTFNSDYCP